MPPPAVLLCRWQCCSMSSTHALAAYVLVTGSWVSPGFYQFESIAFPFSSRWITGIEARRMNLSPQRSVAAILS